MATPRLITDDNAEREYKLAGTVSIGRATDNTVLLTAETVSRYHAIVEERAGGFWLSDLGSIHGTTVNGIPIRSDHRLQDGDVISIGGAVSLRYLADHEKIPATITGDFAADSEVRTDRQEISKESTSEPRVVSSEKAVGGGSNDSLTAFQVGAAVAVGSVFVGIIALIAYLLWPDRQNGGNCGNIRIINPVSGATISESITLVVKADEPQCVKELKYRIDGREFAHPSPGIFELTLDPAGLKNQFPDLEDGDHELSIIAESVSGQLRNSVDKVRVNLVFSGAIRDVPLEKIREQVLTLTAEITGRGDSLVLIPEFLNEIRKATSFYRFDTLPSNEDSSEIRRAFTTNAGFSNSVIGFVLAASRSLFKNDQTSAGCDVDANGVGLLRVPRNVIDQFGEQGNPTLIAAKHLKERINNFGGIEDFAYSIACFGEEADRAGNLFQETSREERRNFWDLVNRGVVKPQEARRVVCFFAAGVVAENPETYGVSTGSLRDLYR